MKSRLIVVGLVASVSLLAACGSSSKKVALPVPSTPPASVTAPAEPSAQPLTIKVTGKCSDPQGYRLQTTGFTPNGLYQTEASYPNGKPYTYLVADGVGKADAAGKLSNWTWDCKRGANNQPDPNGKYFLKVVDLTSHASASTYFVVDESK
jgi:hypothetical protein